MALSKVRSLVVVALVGVLSACAGSPIKVAQTVEQKAYATYGTFVIFEEQAVKLSAPSSNLAPATKAQIINGVQKAQPVVDTMLKSLRQAEQARVEFDAQKIDKPAFQVVVDNLGNWVQQATPLVASLVTVVKGAK
jgi:hypothetical protein